MVQPTKDVDSNISGFYTAIAGGTAGAITRALVQPLDVLKIRFQLQLEPIKQGSKYSSVFQALTTIIKDEGPATLWSGHVPAQLLSVTYGVLQFSTFEKLTQLCQQIDRDFYTSQRHMANFMNGSMAAVVATIVSFPFDTVRTRLIAEEKNNKAYKGFLNALQIMLKTEGPMALYKGLFPTLWQIAPNTGIQFVIYKLFTENIFNKLELFQRDGLISSQMQSTLLANMLAGSIAGFVSKTAIYPFDLLKKRLQIQGFQEHRKWFGQQMYCNGLIDCIKLTIHKEGVLALYKGYMPSMLKAVSVSALHFSVYDEIKRYLMSLNVHGR